MNNRIEIDTENNIMERLQKSAVSHGLRLTYTQQTFYLRLVSYAIEKGELCPEGLKLSLSINDMVSSLNISKRMVIKSLKNLSDCGILFRYNGMTFPRSMTTVIKKEFYERDNT